MQKNLKVVFDYFSYFSYAPTFTEIHTFYSQIITKQNLRLIIANELKRGKIVRLPNNVGFSPFPGSTNHYPLATIYSRYTLPQYSIPPSPRLRGAGKNSSLKAFGTIQFYLSVLKWVPLVRFVGMTGKSAMEGVSDYDDVDLFIVSKAGWIWTTRFMVVLIAKVLGIHGGVGVCLNLFFDERDQTIPKIKQNIYIAHELLQMRPIIDKGNIYHALLGANKWIFDIFPNSRSVIPAKAGIQTLISIQKKVIFDWIPSSEGMTQRIESIFKSIQLLIIKRNKTGFLITPTHLWLFRRDFEKKLKKNRLVE